ncbi:MAG: lipopolysaccharide biosynthesis protein [Rhodospirillales bacterium]
MPQQTALRSLGWSAVESAIGVGMSLLTVLIIARFIGPAEFGLFSLALVTVQILTAVIAQLFNEAIVQREDLGPDHIATAFWTSVVLGFVRAAACAGMGRVLADHYAEPRLGAILAWLGLGIVIEGVNGALLARMRRDMQFRWIAIRTAAGRFAGAAVGIAMAFGGWGVWALVAQTLVGNAVSLACVWAVAPERPRFHWSAARLGELLRVAIPSLGATLLWIAGSRLFAIAVGAVLGRAALGHFSMAFRLIDVLQQLSLGVVNKIALPLLSRRQSDPAALRAGFLAATERTALVVVPLFAGLAVAAPVLVPLVLGPAWEPTIGVLQILSVSIILVGITQFQSAVFTAVGRAHLNLVAPAVTMLITLPMVVLAAPFGLEAATGSWLLRHAVTIPLVLAMTRNVLNLGAGDQLRGTVAPLVAGVAMTLAVAAADHAVLHALGPWPRLMGMVATGAAVYAASILLLAPSVPLSIARRIGAGLRA